MRNDMNKLLCEQERRRSWDKYHNYRNVRRVKEDVINDDDLELATVGTANAPREAMKARYDYGYNRRDFSENLNPLYGFVRKNAGRPWDDVYSELCQTFDKRSVINQHILIHLFQYVEKETRLDENGIVCFLRTDYSYNEWVPIYESFSDYYVHPTTNILTKNDRKSHRQEWKEVARRKKEAELKVKRVINSALELHKINNCWFEVKFEDINGEIVTKEVMQPWYKHPQKISSTVFPYRLDVLLNTHVAAARVAVSKRQLSHRELRKYKLV
ncbi:MAG: hypothetical protein E4H14_05065 [Candidatus Thorarchaeota archaeon]|nr:MAG: hypothetical protein E4H14_05065 [Candidatus Thorarchaeota archaeon]